MASRRSHRHSQRRRRLLVECLELRRVLAAFVVNTSQDAVDAADSLTSLREAVDMANQAPGFDTVSFDPVVFSTASTIDLLLGQLTLDDSVEIKGPDSGVTLRAAENQRVIDAAASATDVTLSRLRITGGRTIDDGQGGGGIRFSSGGILRLVEVTVNDNQTGGDHAPGGAVFVLGTVQLVGSVVSGNSTLGQQSPGGGIHASVAQIVDSTVAFNQTSGAQSDGGGIQTSDLTLTQSTVSDNQALDQQSDGGGISASAGLIVASTIAANRSDGRGGGIDFTPPSSAMLTIQNSIVAGNLDDGAAPDLAHPLSNSDTLLVRHSLIGDNTGTNLEESQVQNADGNLIGSPSPGAGIIDPLLRQLGNHGGKIPTRPLDDASPAINRGNLALSAALQFDQRGIGFPRLYGGRPDLGASERQAVSLNRFIVNTAEDELNFANDTVSLREAIYSANGSVGSDVITFDSTVFTAPSTILLSLGQLEITDSLTIEGPGRDSLSIDAQGLSRVIQFLGTRGDLSLSGLTVTGGSTSDSGGGIFFQPLVGALTLSQMRVAGNNAAGSGGGIDSLGDTFIDGSEISSNQATAGGGGIWAPRVTITSSEILDNVTTSDGAGGGGIAAETATIVDSILANNSTDGIGAQGGALSVAVADVTGSLIRDNQARVASGGGIASSQSLRLIGTTVTGNLAGDDGGGIHATTDGSLAVSASMSSVSLNTASADGSRGGGIFASGNTVLTDSTLSGNQSVGAGADGGGVFVSTGSVEILRSTVAANTATRAGGGLLVPFNHPSPVKIRNAIFALNSDSGIAPNFRGILNLNDLDVDFSLIDDNTGTALAESQVASPRGNLIGRPAPSGSGVIDAGLDTLTVVGDGQVHPLLPLSPAIDAGDAAIPPPHDQRGMSFARVFGPAIDMGALETQSPVQPIIDWNDPNSVAVGTALDGAQLNAIAQTPGTFVYDPMPGEILDLGDDQTLSVTFTPDDTEFFLPTTASVTIDVRPELDFGDAPESFATSLASDGPRHQPGPLTLGDTVDYEIDGQPHRRAGGDATGDNGVSTITSLVVSASHSTTSTLSIETSAASKLDAWIDFNGNGVFDHPDEHIGGGTSINLTRGNNAVSVVVPAGSVPGSTFARFRVSTEGGLLPTGIAADGEVEDHELEILSGAISPQIDVLLPRGGATLSTQSGERFIVQRQRTLLRVVENAVGRFAIVGTEFSDVLVIDASGGATLPTDGLSFDGGDRVNTLRLVGPGVLLDTSAQSNILIRNVDAIDLTDADSQTVLVDAASARNIDPTGGGLILTGDASDQIGFADAENWRMAEPVNVAGFVFGKVVTLGTFVQVDFASPWQNLAQPSDVSNDGSVTAVDALRIINELGRRLFSDASTAALNTPDGSFTWPNSYFDQNGDGKATALDALRVINQLARISNTPAAGEGELFERSIVGLTQASQASMSLGARIETDAAGGPAPLFANGNSRPSMAAQGIVAVSENYRDVMTLDSVVERETLMPSRVDSLLSQREFLSTVLSDLRFD